MPIAELTRNAVDLLPAGALAGEAEAEAGRSRQARHRPDHAGHPPRPRRPLQRMRQFQDEGHTGVLIIGDYTARIGDPAGRTAARPIIAEEEIDRNANTLYGAGLARSSIRDQTEVRRNGEWLAKLDYAGVPALAQSRWHGCSSATTSPSATSGADLALELIYPLMQAYDSVVVQADMELGGTDQLYNLLVGRELMADVRAGVAARRSPRPLLLLVGRSRR